MTTPWLLRADLPSNHGELMIEWVQFALVYCASVAIIMQLYGQLRRRS